MREFTVYEGDLEQVGLLNSLSAFFFSACSGSLLFGFGVWANSRMQESLPPKAQGMLDFALPASIFIALLCGVMAIWLMRKKGSTLDEMKKNAVDIEQAPPPRIEPQAMNAAIPLELDAPEPQQ